VPDKLNDGKQVQKNELGVTAADGGGCGTIVVDPCLRTLFCISTSTRSSFIVLVGNRQGSSLGSVDMHLMR